METKKDVVYVTENTKIYLVEDLIRGVGFESDENVRCSGRTTRIAFKLINLALNNPGKRIVIKDHDDHDNSYYLLNMLRRLLRGFQFFQIESQYIIEDGSHEHFLICAPLLPKKGNNYVNRQKNSTY